jgi:hypothetical protein
MYAASARCVHVDIVLMNSETWKVNERRIRNAIYVDVASFSCISRDQACGEWPPEHFI